MRPNSSRAPHRIRVKVYYEDTDAGGVVYYANYLRFLERARTEFLGEAGIDVHEYHRQGYFFVVTRAELRYRRSAGLGDVLEVTTEVAELRRASLRLRHAVVRDGEVLVEAAVDVAFIREGGRPCRLPEAFGKLGESHGRQ